MTQVKNQDWRSSCSFFATVALVEAEFKRVYNREVDLSEQFVNYNAKVHLKLYAKEEESSLKVDAKMIEKYGLLFEEQWPYHPSYFLKGYPCDTCTYDDENAPLLCYSQNTPPEHVTKKAFFGKYHFKTIPKNIDSLTYFIGSQRRPLAFLFPFYESNWTDSGRVYYDAWEDSLCNNDGICNNHIAIISGYDLEKEEFMIRNSWGDWWGKDGYGTLSFNDFIKEAGEDIYYFELAEPEKFVLPKEEKVKPIKLKAFDVNPVIKNDHSIELDITGELFHLGWHSVVIRSILVLAPNNGKKEYKLSELQEIVFSEQEAERFNDSWARAVWAHVPDKHCFDLKWPKHNPLKLHYSTEMIHCESVQKALQQDDRRLVLMTSLYYFDDTKGFNRLKRVFIDLDKTKLLN